MAQKCLIAASLVFHPRSSIKCFKPKPDPDRTTYFYPTKKHKPAKKKHSTPPKPPHKQPKPKAQASSSSSPSIPRNSSRSNNHLTELLESDWPIDIVAAMFRAGWPIEKMVAIDKILKVNHSLDLLTRFEEYREGVKSKSAKICEPDERTQKLVVDGNELVRYRGALITCSFGRNSASLDICSNR